MNRRKFLKATSLAASAAFIAPYILPTGRLFAATGARKINHVVLCLFAGGLRSNETIFKSEGNLLRNMLYGNEAISADIANDIQLLSPLLSNPLQANGTLYKEFRYKQGPTGHYNGHTTAITGVYTDTSLDLKINPAYPTVFEYYRKHAPATRNALNAWWVSNQLGPYPSLNFSSDANYGASYGANYLQPYNLFNYESFGYLGANNNFTAQEQSIADGMTNFLNKNFNKSATIDYVSNDNNSRLQIDNFFADNWQRLQNGTYNNSWGLPNDGMNNDCYTIEMAEQVLKRFKPELLVVNMTDADIAHSNFTKHCDALVKADYALAHLWQTIQATPGLANDTVLIAVPEHGRNAVANSIVDANGRGALDHTEDNKSREIFCLVAGPPSVIQQNKVITSVTGESIDVVPTILNLLGIDQEVPSFYRNKMGAVLSDALV